MTAWFPCEHPEREPDACVVWHYEDCRACRIAAQTVASRWPEVRQSMPVWCHLLGIEERETL